jgi:signal transduction histidine kinase
VVLQQRTDAEMNPAPIRARIAPIALLVAFAFVVVGFLRADREMARAEEDRAQLMASETATIVELFLVRHLAELRAMERVVNGHSTNEQWLADSFPTIPLTNEDLHTEFDAFWISDSTQTIRAVAAQPTRSTAPIRRGALVSDVIGNHGELAIRALAARDQQPFVFGIVKPNGQRQLAFLETLTNKSLLVGTVSLDSLRHTIEARQRTKSFRLTIASSTDTLLSLSNPTSITGGQTATQTIATPFADKWTVAIAYIPGGRGVRIALWVVGLGAIVGLGIGLLLERREATRIADRSSELEHLSAELLRANRAKSEFLANVSHELRTPLNAIVGFVDLLRDGVYGALNSRQVGPVERIEASANHLRHLVDQVLDLAKMAAGRLEVHNEPLELRPFVFDVASEVEPLITEKGLSFSLGVGATLPRVRTDPTHLRQILINLLGNAVKFTSAGGISIRGKLIGIEDHASMAMSALAATTMIAQSPRPDGVWIALQVADSGIGIPDKDCERIFDEFEQVNAGPRGDSMRRGTGLGLSISRRLARLIGGDITVESELGRGSVFTVWLPVDPADLRGDRAA